MEFNVTKLSRPYFPAINIGHTQKLKFGQKICQQEAISGANDFFFHLPKFSQLSPNFKDAVENILRPTIS